MTFLPLASDGRELGIGWCKQMSPQVQQQPTQATGPFDYPVVTVRTVPSYLEIAELHLPR